MATKISTETFFKRINELMKRLEKDEGSDGLFKGAPTLAFLYGKSNDDLTYSKTSALFRWLTGYDLTDTLLLIDKRAGGKVTWLVSSAKHELLKKCLVDADKSKIDLDGRQPVEVELMLRTKGNERQDLDRILSRLKSGPVGGCWNARGASDLKEPHEGPFASSFLDAVYDETEGIKAVDVSEGVAECFLNKDVKDINFVKSACSIADVVVKKFVIPKIEEEANEGKRIAPHKLSEYINGYFVEPEKISAKLQSQNVDAAYPPLFSSASSMPSNLADYEPSTKPLDYSVIVFGVGAKYKSLCSNIVRTVLINPTEEVTSAYAAVVKAQKAAIDAIKPGASMSDAYKAAQRVLAEHDSQLAACLDPCVGHSIGYEFCEGVKLTQESSGKFGPGMAFNVMILLQNYGGKSVIGLGDTVVVTGEGCQVVTKATKDGLQYDLDDKESSGGDDEIMKKGVKLEEDVGKRKSRMRDQSALNSELELKQKQKENFERLQRELEERAERGDDNLPVDPENQVKDWMTLAAYPKGASSFPTDATPFRMVVDQENETILMPMNGFVVPIHISLIKSALKVDDTIRFQFHVPGKGKMSIPANNIMEEQPDTVWIKEVVYRLSNANLLSSIDRSIKEMRKRVQMQEKRKADLAGIVEQDNLVLARERTPSLNNLICRPSLSGKRIFGTLEAHKNGFRYTTVKGQKLDIIYNNIANAFFQPAEQEALVILHFHLRNPVVIGKKKTWDVQFVQETMEASSRLDSRRRNYGDADEIEEEQREKLQRKKINKSFYNFCKQSEDFANRHSDEGKVIEFEFPSRELGFTGVPFKSNVFLQPTTLDCLVHLVEGPPFFVLSLKDVEVASFERVMFGLRQFDLVFVLKDWSKTPITINSIPVEALETLQEWLTKCDVLFYLNPQPMNWTMIMNEIRHKSVKDFLKEGGWSFLGKEEDEQEEEDEDDDDSDGFEPSASESESDFDEDDDFDEEDDEDDEEEESDEDDDEEADWDELEKEAARKDKKRFGGEERTQKRMKK